MRGKASGELEVKCGACGVVSVLGASAVTPPTPPPSPAEQATTCPKCSHRQRNAESCDRCGLVFARWDPGKALAPTDEAAEALWAAVEQDWGADGKHRAFLDYCTAMGLFAYAAQQYGRVRADDARRERAAAEIARLGTVAQAALAASQPGSSRWSVRRIRTAMIVVTFVVCVALLLLIATRFL